MSDLADLDLVALADAIAQGDVTAEAATASALARATDHAHLNAFVAIHADHALEAAQKLDRARSAGAALGLLHGVPLAHKDMFYRAGRVSGCGSKIRVDFVASETCPLLDRLDAAGAVEIGRLHMAEFAMGPTGHNAHLGRCRNPWRGDAITGGSSSGSGAAVGARIVTGALGSDTGGSVRLPAGICGVVGLKPTHDLLPRSAMMPLSESLDTAGPLARSSRSIARLMTVLTEGREDYEAGLSIPLDGVTIGVPVQYYTEDMDAEVAAAFATARELFVDLGANVIDIHLPDHASHAAMAGLVWAPEAAALHLDWLRDRPQDYGEQVRNRLVHGLSMPATSYVRARRLRSHDLRAMVEGPLAACDMLLTPLLRNVVPLARDVEANAGPEMDRVIGGLSALTRTISYLGLPALTTPMGFDTRGLPIGLQLIGRPRGEAALIRAGHAHESVAGWLRRPLPHPSN
jgi:aspartyl-tRNA(Asn)/glutamyl-tRNA(Gln) amidotransferase subunit A